MHHEGIRRKIGLLGKIRRGPRLYSERLRHIVVNMWDFGSRKIQVNASNAKILFLSAIVNKFIPVYVIFRGRGNVEVMVQLIRKTIPPLG